MGKPKNKQPRAPALAAGPGRVAPTKQVPAKVLRNLGGSDDSGTLIIRFNQTDVGGPWCLSKATPDQMRRLLEAVTSYETMTPIEAFKGRPGKDYPAKDLPTKEAIERLIDLGLDDQDSISRLSLTGEERLYGFRRGRYFHVLWWDPHHQIWPSKLKHT